MIIFDQLRISDDGKRMYLNFHVNTASYFEDVTLESVTVIPALSDGELQISETDCTSPTDHYIYKKIYGEDIKEDGIVLDKAVLDEAFNNTDSQGEAKHDGPTAKAAFTDDSFSSNLYFVYVKCVIPEDKLNPCVPCSSASAMTTLGVTFDESLLYQKVMQFTKDLAADCTVPTSFTDFILLWNAFKASVETEHYVPAVKYYQMLFGTDAVFAQSSNISYNSKTGIINKPCGCHG